MTEKEMFDPMEKYIPKHMWKHLMFMGTVEGIFLYKHIITRQYINVNSKGEFFKYTGESYQKISAIMATGRIPIFS